MIDPLENHRSELEELRKLAIELRAHNQKMMDERIKIVHANEQLALALTWISTMRVSDKPTRPSYDRIALVAREAVEKYRYQR